MEDIVWKNQPQPNCTNKSDGAGEEAKKEEKKEKRRTTNYSEKVIEKAILDTLIYIYFDLCVYFRCFFGHFAVAIAKSVKCSVFTRVVLSLYNVQHPSFYALPSNKTSLYNDIRLTHFFSALKNFWIVVVVGCCRCSSASNFIWTQNLLAMA